MDEAQTLFAPDDEPGSSGIERQIGQYKLLSKLGEGGMGEVWLAEQESPRREVALKVIKRGMDVAQVVARFETERQALAVMDHPNIARVIDGGETSRGRPYFVMEYVKGEPINAYCDRNRLTTRQRIELFVQVCEGVQHAHQKAVIHRDLKPSNILVTVQGDQAIPKIIDFGVAKATNQRLTERTLFTELGQLIGTPEYMSPEQAAMTTTDIDTRTDVYSLGVVLYELLTGVLPFDPRELRAGGLAEIQRRIREEEPSKPSTRVSSLGDTSVTVAQHRRVDASTLIRRLRGDLDWITVRALEKDRRARYESPEHLAADLRRHLRDEAVVAGPPSGLYRARKFLRRHRSAAMVTLALGGAVLLGLIGTSLGLVRALKAESESTFQARSAEQVIEFLVELFQDADAGRTGGSLTAVEMLERGAGELQSELRDQPRVRARLLEVVGAVLTNIAELDKAESLLVESVAERRQLLGPDHPEVAASLLDLGRLRGEQDRLDEALDHYREALRIYELSSPEAPDIAELYSRIGGIHLDAGRYVEAETSLLQALTGFDELESDVGRARALRTLGVLYNRQGQLDRAKEALEQALDLGRRAYGALNPYPISVVHSLANVAASRGDYDESLGLARQVTSSWTELYGPEHVRVAGGLELEATALWRLGRYPEAESSYQKALELYERTYGSDHSKVALTLNNMALVALSDGRFGVGAGALQKALPVLESSYGSDHPRVASAVSNLAYALAGLERFDEAVTLEQRALAARRRAFGESHNVVARSLSNLGGYQLSVGDLDQAEQTLQRALEIRAEALGPDHPELVGTLSRLGDVAVERSDTMAAVAFYERALEIRGRALEPDHPEIVALKEKLASASGATQ